MENFRLNFKTQYYSKFEPELIFNSDQTPFFKEMAAKRTLDFKGIKDVKLRIQNRNAVSHSYTLMPTISMSGKCFGKLLIVFQEKNGKFGQNIFKKVKELEEKLKNIRVFCTKSGKMGSNECNRWAKENFSYENIKKLIYNSDKPNVLLYLDSYPGHWNNNFDSQIDCEQVNLIKLKIPENTTSVLQPLDCHFNHELKYFMRQFENRVILENLNIKIYDRFCLMRVWSLIYEQISSLKFNPMIKSCFNTCFLEISSPYESMKNICFSSEKSICEIINCNGDFFIKCSLCEISLCLEHFYLDFHSHNQ